MTQIVYRSLPAADLERFIQVETHAFNANPDRVRLTPELLDQLRGLYVAGELVAQLQLLPLRVMTGAGDLPCGGLSSVATPPEQRRRGYTATLLRHTCAELSDSGVMLAMLHPFKRAFYQRYGWATFMERRVYHGAPEQFAHFRRAEGGFVPVGPEAIPELQQIYAGSLRGRFGPVLRDDAWWRRNVLRSWSGETHVAFVWRDAGGAGRAYLIYHLSPWAGSARTLTCREMVALDPTARAQLFNFLADHDSQCSEVVFRAPADAPVNLLMREPLRCEVEPHFMLRLIDAGAALAAFPYPADVAGRLSISIADDWLTTNQGVFALEVGGGQARCTRLPAGSPADLACDVRVLTQIYARYVRPRTAAAFGLLTVHDRAALALADRLFAGLAPFSSDFF